MHLQAIDWLIVVVSLLICFVPALFFGKRGGKNTSEFFAAGRSVPWWLAGLSMVATTFSSDTPNLVTDIVRRYGVAGNWLWWAMVLTGVATVFFFARLWRRSAVMTDLEYYEVRYSGKAASVVRGFRAIYLGLFFNCFIMASVLLAACKIANILFGLDRWQTLLICGLLNVVFAAHSGLWGVLVIDMIQFFIKMTAVTAAAYYSVKHVGGLDVMVDRIRHLPGPLTDKCVDGVIRSGGQPLPGFNFLDMMPSFANSELTALAVMVFVVPIVIQWWSTWYPGAEPGGGSYIAQRMLASKSERDSLGAVLFFNVAHYVLRPWPWILVALCSLLVYPDLASIQAQFPDMDPKLLGHDIAYPAMLRFLPVGFIGLMVGGLIAANSSTILTHLNWGSSYLVHDFYQRFVKKTASERHYVWMGRASTLGLYVLAAGLVYALETAKDNFQIMLQIGAGTGLLYLLRWFWWRINAWCEVGAMISSFGISLAILLLKKFSPEVGAQFNDTISLLVTIGGTTVCWVLLAYFGPQTDRGKLIDFYQKVRPFGPGWARIRVEAGISLQQANATHENIPLATLGWLSGCTLIWASLFTVGNFLYGRWIPAFLLLGTAVFSCMVLLFVINRLWAKDPHQAAE